MHRQDFSTFNKNTRPAKNAFRPESSSQAYDRVKRNLISYLSKERNRNIPRNLN